MTALGDASHVFAGSRVLITGGLGCLGSSLAIPLAQSGAKVTLIDAQIDGYGANSFNIEPVRDLVTVLKADVRDADAMNNAVRDQDYVFHMAGQVDHVQGRKDPFPDIEINIRGTAVVLEAIRHNSPQARFIYAGTRGQYGHVDILPADENTPTNPLGMYEATKLAGEKLVQVYTNQHGVRGIMLRISNVYGPRGQMRHPRYGVANWFVRLALDDQTLKVFGDGKVLRDFLYVDDCIEAILRLAACDTAIGQAFNVGHDRPVSFIELAETIVAAAGSGRWELAPYSEERKGQEPGDFYPELSKIAFVVGWLPRTSLAEGMEQTVEYYRQHRAHYWSTGAAS